MLRRFPVLLARPAFESEFDGTHHGATDPKALLGQFRFCPTASRHLPAPQILCSTWARRTFVQV